VIIMWDEFKKPSFKFFGKSLERFVPYFESLKSDLPRANLRVTLREYVYIMFFVMFLMFLVELPFVVIITALLFNSAMLAFVFSFTIIIILELGIFFMFYTYPAYLANTRKKKIEAGLPFATTYMATIASSGAPPITMFKILGKFKEYGEISKEAAKIYRDVSVFGMDLKGAIRKTASRTPSSELKELFWGLETVISSGGNVSDYLHEKSKGFMVDYKRRLKQFSQTLSLLIEMYLTVVLVGSIFFVIMSALMSIFGGGETSSYMSALQFIIIFIGLPVVSLGFIGVLRVISPDV